MSTVLYVPQNIHAGHKNAIICMSCFFHSFRSKESFSKGASHVAKSQVCVFKNGASVSASARQLNLSMLEYACPDKTSRQISHATNTCLSRQKFCRGLSWEAYFCRYKRCVLSRQTCVCRDKSKLDEKNYVFCSEKHMSVATKCLSRQKLYLRKLPPMIWDHWLYIIWPGGVRSIARCNMLTTTTTTTPAARAGQTPGATKTASFVCIKPFHTVFPS